MYFVSFLFCNRKFLLNKKLYYKTKTSIDIYFMYKGTVTNYKLKLRIENTCQK